jgi:Asp-tRNA(Asn)/Glu-tRNA(Gln) amidotransferase A subunit family amidase
VLAGHDPRDPGSARRAVPDFSAQLSAGVRGLRIGVLEDEIAAGPSGEIAARVRAALDVLRAEGARLVRVRLETLASAREAAFVILFAESAESHRARWSERPQEFFPDVLARFERGRALSALDFVRALAQRAAAAAEVAERFRTLDLLATACVPIEAPSLGADTTLVEGRPVEVTPQLTAHTREWNLLGHPVLALPCGVGGDGLPCALQIVARPFAEATLLRAGVAYQRATDWHRRQPRI